MTASDERHPAGLRGRRRYRSAHRLRGGRDGSAGQISRGRRSIAAAARSGLSGRCGSAEALARRRRAQRRTGHRDRSAQSLPHRSRQGGGAVLSAASDHRAACAHGISASAADPGLAPPPEGVRTALLAASSQDSYRRPPSAAGGTALASAEQAAPDAEDRGAQALAVAVEGRLAGRRRRQAFPPGASPAPANSPATNISPTSPTASFRSRCCAGSPPTRRCRASRRKPISSRKSSLTNRQMRDVFIALEVLLPLSTLLCGVLVWWRRR